MKMSKKNGVKRLTPKNTNQALNVIKNHVEEEKIKGSKVISLCFVNAEENNKKKEVAGKRTLSLKELLHHKDRT